MSVLICLAVLLSAFSTSLTANAAESDNVAKFSLIVSASKNISKGEKIKVDVYLNTSYPIYAVSLPVVYKSDLFTMKNTSETDLKSYLNFSGKLSSGYVTNGNWKSPDAMYLRNSNPSYWNSVKDQFKIAFATWTADSNKNNIPITLKTAEKIVSFELEAKTFIEEISKKDIYIPMEFKKTSSCPGGLLFVGRCSGEKLSDVEFVSVGQTINVHYSFNNITVKNIKTQMNYKTEKDLMTYVDNYSRNQCVFTSSNEKILSVDGSTAKAVARGNAQVTVTVNSETVAIIDFDVTYTWWQWIIKIVLFGWIWY